MVRLRLPASSPAADGAQNVPATALRAGSAARAGGGGAGSGAVQGPPAGRGGLPEGISRLLQAIGVSRRGRMSGGDKGDQAELGSLALRAGNLHGRAGGVWEVSGRCLGSV